MTPLHHKNSKMDMLAIWHVVHEIAKISIELGWKRFCEFYWDQVYLMPKPQKIACSVMK